MSNSPSEYPTALELTSDSHLRITWNDDSESQIAFAVLRKHCPCAHCRVDARKPKPVELLPVISAAEAQTFTHRVDEAAWQLCLCHRL